MSERWWKVLVALVGALLLLAVLVGVSHAAGSTSASMAIDGAAWRWPPTGWVWTCFYIEGRGTQFCAYLPPRVAAKLPCRNCR